MKNPWRIAGWIALLLLAVVGYLVDEWIAPVAGAT